MNTEQVKKAVAAFEIHKANSRVTSSKLYNEGREDGFFAGFPAGHSSRDEELHQALKEILSNSQEYIGPALRTEAVDVSVIKQVFEKLGIEYQELTNPF